jgi:hypothetical protein
MKYRILGFLFPSYSLKTLLISAMNEFSFILSGTVTHLSGAVKHFAGTEETITCPEKPKNPQS